MRDGRGEDMSELEKCFTGLGFTEPPATEQEVIDRCGELMEKFKDSTESDRLAQQMLRENRDMCLAEIRRS